MAKADNRGALSVLSARTIIAWGAGLLLLAIAVGVALTLLNTGSARDSTLAKALTSIGGVALGISGAASLLLSARKQHAAERDAAATEFDAAERRVTELYGKAADQLGSDRGPVRLAGVYALERLAQGSPAHRQTVVNLLCAYLRMPATASITASITGATVSMTGEEREVRLAVQDVLVRHVRPGEAAAFWPDTDLNLTGAALAAFTMTHCAVRSARFHSARFLDHTTFRGSTFRTQADFRQAEFAGDADFRRMAAAEDAEISFTGARFTGEVDFGTASTLPVTGARTRTDDAVKRRWPDTVTERELPDEPGWAVLVPIGKTTGNGNRKPWTGSPLPQ